MTQRTCSFDGCTNAHSSIGLCTGHRRQRSLGRPLTALRRVARRSDSLANRMDAKTDKSGTCWLWTGAVNDVGYGQIRYGGKALYVHRVAWQLANETIEKDFVIDHKCYTRTCVNPSHLHVVTNKQNSENWSQRSDNTSGARGVYWCNTSHRWMAVVWDHGKRFAKSFESKEQAELAVVAMRNELFTNNLMDRAPDCVLT